jgi:hypothetical protein
MYLVKIRCHCIWVCVLIAKWWRDLHFELNVSTPMFPLCAIRDGRFRNTQDQTDNDPSIKLLFSWGNEILTVFFFFRLEIGENTKILFFGFSKKCLRSPPKEIRFRLNSTIFSEKPFQKRFFFFLVKGGETINDQKRDGHVLATFTYGPRKKTGHF